MSSLKNTIEGLASQFALDVISALRGMSLDELATLGQPSAPRRGRPARAGEAGGTAPAAPAARRGRGGRLGRRSAAQIGGMVDAIVSLLGKNPNGLRAEQIRDALGCEAKELPRPLADALAAGQITKEGQKRATTYFAAGGGGGSAPAKRRGGGRKKRG